MQSQFRSSFTLPNRILEVGLGAMEDAWLELRCCFGTAALPVQVLAQRHGFDCLLGEVMARLRCQQCHEVPAAFTLINAPGAGLAPHWRVPLDRTAALALSIEVERSGACVSHLARVGTLRWPKRSGRH